MSWIPAVVLIAALAGCSGAERGLGKEYKHIGLYQRDKKKIRYTFRDMKDAQKLAMRVERDGNKAVIQLVEKDGKKGYRVYVKEFQPTEKDLVWPKAPAKARIRYVGLLPERLEERSSLKEALGGVTKDVPEAYPRFVRGMAADADGNIYVSHSRGVLVFDVKEQRMRPFASRYAAWLPKPEGIAVAPDGRVYVADSMLKQVVVFRKEKPVLRIGAPGEFGHPSGIAIDQDRLRVYVTDSRMNSVRAYDLNGNLLFTIEPPTEGGIETRLGAPVAAAVNSAGELYVIDQGGSKINVYSPEGAFIRHFGGPYSTPGNFVRPKSIAIDSDDNVYVLDAGMDNFQVFDSQGRLLLVVGQAGRVPGRFHIPFSLVINNDDTLFVADHGTNRIQLFQYLSDMNEAYVAQGKRAR